MIQYCGISHEHLDYMIDDAPAKHGFYTPGSHFPIYPGTILSSDNAPDYVVVFAWSFFKEIIIRNETFLKKVDSLYYHYLKSNLSSNKIVSLFLKKKL